MVHIAVRADLKPVADAFIKLIKMLIALIIFCTVVIGIAHVGDLKSVGRIGVKALIYFEIVTTFALLFGLLWVSVNLLGNCVATMVVARWEGQLDSDRMKQVLSGEVVEGIDFEDETETPEVVVSSR